MDNEMSAINNSEGFFGNRCSLCPALCLTPNPNSKSNFNFRTCDPHASYSQVTEIRHHLQDGDVRKPSGSQL